MIGTSTINMRAALQAAQDYLSQDLNAPVELLFRSTTPYNLSIGTTRQNSIFKIGCFVAVIFALIQFWTLNICFARGLNLP